MRCAICGMDFADDNVAHYNGCLFGAFGGSSGSFIIYAEGVPF
jgi:hypothetical protein